MRYELIKDKVYYKIFDKGFKDSSGIYNINKFEDNTKLSEILLNINNIKKDLGAEDLLILNQVHGNKVIERTTRKINKLIEADGSVTVQRNIALGILTADCVPVLFASEDGSVIGSAHCGRKSAQGDIVKNIAALMRKKGAGVIKAVIGPAIRQESYEVGPEYYQDFIDGLEDNKRFFNPSGKENHFMFDLVGYVKQKLINEDILILHDIGEDTYSMPEKYYSYRFHVHNGTPYTQNILSTIIIK